MGFVKVKKEQEREGEKVKKLGRFLKAFFGVVCVIYVAVFIWLAVDTHKAEMVLGAVLFAVPTYFLLRKKKVKPEPQSPTAGAVRREASQYTPDAPEETLRDMRMYYTKEQIENDVRILSESFKLAQQTANIDTFTSRLALAQRTALTLLQAEKAGCKGILPGTSKTCDQVLSSVKDLKIAFLENSYIKETTEAMLLKTPSGQRKRMEAYLAKLEAHKTDFLSRQTSHAHWTATEEPPRLSRAVFASSSGPLPYLWKITPRTAVSSCLRMAPSRPSAGKWGQGGGMFP